jgi:hypothetical protein
MREGVDGLMLDTRFRLRQTSADKSARRAADKPRYSGFGEWLNGNRGKGGENQKLKMQNKKVSAEKKLNVPYFIHSNNKTSP